MASQEHVELLVLVTLRRGPASGRELAERLRADSGGGLAPPPTTIQKPCIASPGTVSSSAGPTPNGGATV